MTHPPTVGQALLVDLLEEARWVECVGAVGRGVDPVHGAELDALLEALVRAQQLRRHLASRLARERAGEWKDEGAEQNPAPLRR